MALNNPDPEGYYFPSTAEENDLNNDSSGNISSYQNYVPPSIALSDTNDNNEATYNNNNEATYNNNNNNNNNTSSWKFTDIGQVIGPTSRDGSIHATDEVFSSASHLAAFMISLLGTVLLIVQSSTVPNFSVWKIVTFSIYGLSLMFLFGCSTLHHSISGSPSHPQIEERLRMLDYIAIYPLIAGTFSPMCLIPYHSSVIGWAFFGVVWIWAICGIIVTVLLFTKIPKWFSMTTYITLGWLGALMTNWIIPIVGPSGTALFILGGIFYTAGAVIYTTEQPNPIPGKFGFHEIWHLAVILGATSHWCLAYFYLLPWQED